MQNLGIGTDNPGKKSLEHLAHLKEIMWMICNIHAMMYIVLKKPQEVYKN
jgi:hypothetical protein